MPKGGVLSTDTILDAWQAGRISSGAAHLAVYLLIRPGGRLDGWLIQHLIDASPAARRGYYAELRAEGLWPAERVERPGLRGLADYWRRYTEHERTQRKVG